MKSCSGLFALFVLLYLISGIYGLESYMDLKVDISKSEVVPGEKIQITGVLTGNLSVLEHSENDKLCLSIIKLDPTTCKLVKEIEYPIISGSSSDQNIISLSALTGRPNYIDTSGFEDGHYIVEVSIIGSEGELTNKNNIAFIVKKSPNIVFNIYVKNISIVNNSFYPVVENSYIKNIGNQKITSNLFFEILYKNNSSYVSIYNITDPSWVGLELDPGEQYDVTEKINEKLSKIRLNNSGIYMIVGHFGKYSSMSQLPKVKLREYVIEADDNTLEYHLIAEPEGSYQKCGVFNINGSNSTFILNRNNTPIDVCLVFDTTGSMGDEIDVIKNNVVDLINNISNRFSDYRFALISYKDHPIDDMGDPGDYPCRIDCNFTNNLSEITNAVNSLYASGGADIPESLPDALHVAINNLSWRNDAYKMIIIITDAPPHDPEIDGKTCPNNYSYKEETYSAKDRGIVIDIIGCSGIEEYNADEIYQWMAKVTGGKFVYLKDIDELVNTITSFTLEGLNVIGTNFQANITFSKYIYDIEPIVPKDQISCDKNQVIWNIPVIKSGEYYESIFKIKYNKSIKYVTEEINTSKFGKLHRFKDILYAFSILDNGTCTYKPTISYESKLASINYGTSDWAKLPAEILLKRPYKTKFMVVASPLFAQAMTKYIVETKEKFDYSEDISDDMLINYTEIENALNTILEKHPDAYIYFVDNDIYFPGGSFSEKRLEMDVNSMYYLSKYLNVIPYGKISNPYYRQLVYNLTVREVMNDYRYKVMSKIHKVKPDYVVILGNYMQFPELVYNNIHCYNSVCSYDLLYGSEFVGTNYEFRMYFNKGFGRLGIDTTPEYYKNLKIPKDKIAVIYSDTHMFKYDVLNHRKNETRDNLSIMLRSKKYDVHVILDTDNRDNAIKNVNNVFNKSMYIALCHGNVGVIRDRNILKHFVDNKKSPTVFTATSCLVGYFNQESLTNKVSKLGTTCILNSGSGVTSTAGGDSNTVVLRFVDNILHLPEDDPTIGMAWKKTIEGAELHPNSRYLDSASPRYNLETYCTFIFRILGDPSLNIEALDDNYNDTIEALPKEVDVLMSLSYNITNITENEKYVNINITNIESPVKISSLDVKQYSLGTGSPVVPYIFLTLEMPANQTIDSIDVELSSKTSINNISLVRDVVAIVTPNGTKVIPGTSVEGRIPIYNYTVSTLRDPEKRVLKIAIYPVQYDIDNKTLDIYKNINIKLNTKIEEPVFVKVNALPEPTSLALIENSIGNISLRIWNDLDSIGMAENVTMKLSIPDGLKVIYNEKEYSNELVVNIGNLTKDVDGFTKIITFKVVSDKVTEKGNKILNITITYTDSSGYNYKPVTIHIPVIILPKDYIDLEVSKIELPESIKLNSVENIKIYVKNSGRTTVYGANLKVYANNNEIGEYIIDKIEPNEIKAINISYAFNTSGIIKIRASIDPLIGESNINNNELSKEVHIISEKRKPVSGSLGNLLLNKVSKDIKSMAIKSFVGKAKLIVGSDVDKELSAKNLKEEIIKVTTPEEITENTILIGGPVANPLTKKYMDKFPVKITNDYPGKNKGVIQVITLKHIKVGENIYGEVTVILLAGSDRWGTKAAVEYFKQLDDLPKEPIFVEWRDGKAVKIEKP